jgi:hypothetical protein
MLPGGLIEKENVLKENTITMGNVPRFHNALLLKLGAVWKRNAVPHR